jgi:hypothetical protein
MEINNNKTIKEKQKRPQQEQISKEEMYDFINYIKNHKDKYWYLEKDYKFIFMRETIKYHLLYKTQKILVKKTIIGIDSKTVVRYANKYCAYRIKEFINWFMETENNEKETKNNIV